MNIWNKNTYTWGLRMSGRDKSYVILYDIMGNHGGNSEHPYSITLSMKRYLNSYINVFLILWKAESWKILIWFVIWAIPQCTIKTSLGTTGLFSTHEFYWWNTCWCLVIPCITPHGQMALMAVCCRFIASFPVCVGKWHPTVCFSKAYMKPLE